MSLQRLLTSVAALVVLAVTGPAATPVTAAAPAPEAAAKHTPAQLATNPVRTAAVSLKREVFGFALASSLADASYGYPSWNFSMLSTVAYFGLHVNWDGTLVADSGWNVWNSSALTGLLSTAHAKSTKVVVTIVLQDFQPGTPNMCAGLINRATTVNQTVAQVAAKHVDGVNVDYEGLNGICQNAQTSASMLTDFLRQLRAALPSASYLSIDTYAGAATDTLGFFDVPGLNAYVDSFFVMAYDLEYSNWRRSPLGCVSFCLGPTAPLTGYYYNDTNTASQYMSVVPASKVILGVPYYGRKACVGAGVANAYPSGSVTADTYLDASTESIDPAVQSGTFSAHRDANDPAGAERWDTWYNTSLGCTRELYWDDAVSLGAKYDLVNRDGLRGVGVWTLNYGGSAPELWSALSSHFFGCTSVSAGASLYPPQPVGTVVSINALAGACPDANPLYEFWILAPGSTWQVAQAYSTASSYKWSTAGLPIGSYRFSVWVKDAASSASYDAFNASVIYTLVYKACAAVTVTSAPATWASVGTAVTVTGGATNCPNPQYEFWVLAPGAGTWQLGQAFSSSASFAWSTVGKTPGVYRFSVWAKDALSTAAYDSFNAGSYFKLVLPCTALAAAITPKSPTTVGTPVTVTASGMGCPNPLYEFWILSPGASTWLLAQGYSSAPSYHWANTGDGLGAYRFSVWAKDAASSAAYDTFDASQYFTLTSPCSAVKVTASPASSMSVGTTGTVTGAATGCSSPQYEFWILNPAASTWQLAQAYSSSVSFQWTTTGKQAGAYRFSVWVKDSASLASYDAFNAGSFVTLVNGCATVTVSTSPGSTAASGTGVTVAGAAAGCSSPLYEFWILSPGATTWQLVQAYSSSATYQWNTTGKAKGVYRFSVWAKDAGSAASYDAFNAGQYFALS
jgi:spore germination protein YaaH